jgi:subtilisin family serine protease
VLGAYTSTDRAGGFDFFTSQGRTVLDGGVPYAFANGTSMASPHVAGVAALIRQRHPGWNPGAVAAAIRRTATSMSCPTNWPVNDPRKCTGGAGKTSFFGAGMVNALAAAGA